VPAVSDDAPKPKGGRGRLVLSIVFLVVAALLAPLTVVAGWARTQLTDTDAYVDTIAPLADDPDVQAYVADQLAAALITAADVQARLDELLPPELAPAIDPITTAVNGAISAATQRFTASPAFGTLWEAANRAAHTVISGVLTADLEATDLENGQLTLDLGVALPNLQDYLVEQGFEFIGRLDLSNVDAQIVLAEGEQLAKIETARELVGKLDTFVWVLFVATLLLAALSVLVAPKKPAALIRLAVAIALVTVMVAIALSVARQAFLSALVETVPSNVAASLFDTVVGSMRAGFRSIFVVGIVIAALVAIANLPGFARRWARPTQIGVAVLGVVALLARDDLTTTYIVFVVVLTVTGMITLELVRRRRLAQGEVSSTPAVAAS